MRDTKEYFILAAILVFAVFIRIPALTQPIGPDQGIMSVIGQGLLKGEVPYKDNWEMASPAIFFTYAFIYKLFGNNMVAVPAADMLMAIACTFLVFVLGKKLYGRWAAMLSAFLYTLFSNGVSIGMNSAGELTTGTYWYIAQRESFVLPFIVLGNLVVLKGMQDKKTIWFGLLGLLGGILFLYKFPFLLIFVVQLFFLNDFKKCRLQLFRSEFFKKNGLALLGFIVALIPAVWFFYTNDAFQQMIDATFVYVYSIYGEMEMSYTGIIKSGFIKTVTVAREGFVIWIFCISSCIYIVLNEREKKNLFIVSWFLVSLLVVVAHREFFGYHYLIIFPPLSILSGYAIKRIHEQIKLPKYLLFKETKIIIIIFAILANLIVYASINYKHYTRFLRYRSGQKTLQWYYGHFTAYPKHEYSFPADYKVSQFLLKNADSSDKLFILGGIESVIHILTGLKSPSRFVYSWHLFTTERSQTRIAARYRTELLNDLLSKIPKYIVSIGPLDNYRRYSHIHGFVRKNYKLIQTFPDDRYLFVLNI